MWTVGRPRRLIVGASILSLLLAEFALLPAGASTMARVPRQTSASGTIRIAAEEELTCADWIASCSGSSWGNWSFGNLTLSQALNVGTDGNYVPSSMLVDLPTLDPGPPMKITYRIKPEAAWDDGQPITSKDFEYTWKQIVTSRDIYDPTGYVDIGSIDTTDPKVAVVTFKKTYAAWRDLFGGFYYLLPSHLLAGKDRNKELKDGYAFSAGPWKLQGGRKGWKKGKSLTFVPNDAYWGVKPSIAKVIFQFVPESSAELQAVKTGQVVAAYPLPIDGFLDQLDATPNLHYSVSQGNQTESFFINAAAFPMNSQAVREAVAYATDRQAIVDQILKPAIREGRVLQSFVVPNFKTFFTPSFARYSPNQSMVDQLMTGDGWKKNGSGIWAKGGRTASFTVSTTAGNKSRELSEQLWQSQLRQAGFDVKIKNVSSDVLFGDLMPNGRYAVVLAAGVGTPDPGQCLTYCSKNIPTKKKPSGQNWTRTRSAAIDEQWGIVETSLDDAARTAAAKLGQDALAEYVASLPLYQAPTTFVYDQSKLGGRLEDNTVMGPFFTMNEWVLK